MFKNIPNDWKIENISDVVFFQEGPGVRKTQFRDNGVKLLNVGNINNNKINLSATKIYISEEEAYEKYKHFLIDDGDLLIACSGIVVSTFHKKIAFITKKDLPLCLNTSTMRFRTLNDKNLDINFFKFFLMTDTFRHQLQRLITGSAQLNFGPSHIRKMFIPIPPLPQQEKIVKVLDISSALIEKQKELIGKYDLFLKAKFVEMFGDPIGNPMGWEVVKFEDIVVLQRGHDLPTDKRDKNGTVKVFGSNGVLGYHNEVKVKGGGIITGRSGTLGKVHYTFEDYWPLNTTLFSKDLKGNNIIFLAYFLEMFKVERFTQGAGVPTLNRNLVHKEKTYKISLELQNKFASIVEKVETIKEQENQKLKQLEILHDSLMSRAFKGEIR